MNNMDYREALKEKQKIVVKVGSSTLVHEETGNINYDKLERLVRILCDIKNHFGFFRGNWSGL